MAKGSGVLHQVQKRIENAGLLEKDDENTSGCINEMRDEYLKRSPRQAGKTEMPEKNGAEMYRNLAGTGNCEKILPIIYRKNLF